MEKSNRIKLILTDIDGVWTDGGMYYDQMGNELKRFNTYDGGGVYLAHRFGIKVGIITGETTKIVEVRAKKVKADYLFQGIMDKLAVVKDLCEKESLQFDEVAYIGDDTMDVPVLKAAVFSACPSSAHDYVKRCADIVLSKKGGEGVFREFVELIINNKYGTSDVLEALDKFSIK